MQVTQNTRPSGAWIHSISQVLRALWVNFVKLVRYAFSMLWIVDSCRKLVYTGGIIAESAFLSATIYVTVNAVAHPLLRLFLSADWLMNLNEVSIIAFSILPELILVSAIVTCFDHWKMFKRTKAPGVFVWAFCYTVPTTIFLVMTVQLLISFMGSESVTGAAPVATGGVLILRCLAGLSYSILQMLWDRMGEKETYTHRFDEMLHTISELRDTLTRSTSEFEKALSESDALQKSAAMQSATQIAQLESDVVARTAKIAELESTLLDAHITLANRKAYAESAASSATGATKKVVRNTFTRTKKTPSNVLQMDITAKKERIKEHMKSAIVADGKVNLRKIASDANVSYAMVRKHSEALLKEITEELTPLEREG